jgi:tetratricopeptide (TPR) repeat protein
MRFHRPFSGALLLLFLLSFAGQDDRAFGQAVGGQPEPAKSAGLNCKVDHEAASDAAKALSRREYDAALGLFRGMETESPDVSRAGVIHTLLAEGKVQDSENLAKRWTITESQSAVGLETWGEVLFREGQLPEALKTVLDSQKLSPCNARVYLVVGRVQDLAGNHAIAARQFRVAHMLAPNDLDIDNEWIATQPRSKQLERGAALAKDESLLNAKDRKRMAEALNHARDYNKDDCKPVQPVANAELHMEEILEDSNDRRSFGLYVKLSGKQRTLEIDSGASGILLSRAAAAKLGVTHNEETVVGGIGDDGGIQSAVAHVPSIQIGGMEFKNCPVTILEKHDKLGIDGLIGTDFFSKYLVTLDFPDRKVKLSPLPTRPGDRDGASSQEDDNAAPVFHDRYVAPEMKDWTMVWRDGHDLLVPVSIGAARDKLFIIDTGAGLMSISPNAAKEVTKVHSDFDTDVVGLSGEVAHIYQTQQFLVTFAHVRLHVGSMTAMDTKPFSQDEGFEISGFMGAPVLNRMMLQIDYRDNLVNFNYDEKKDPAKLAPMPFY